MKADLGFAPVGILMALFPLYVLLWNLVGREIITVDNSEIVIRKTVLGIGIPQTYQLSLVHNLRVSLANPTLFTWEHNMQEWGLAGGSVAFDYQGKVYRFGILLRKQHADILVTKIIQYLSSSVHKFSTLEVKV
jgi:hypothetical protein